MIQQQFYHIDVINNSNFSHLTLVDQGSVSPRQVGGARKGIKFCIEKLVVNLVRDGGGNGNPLQYSCLENPMDRGAWQATVHRVDCKESDMTVLTKYSTLYSLEKQNILLFPKYTIFFSSHTLDFVCSEVSSLSIVLVLSH